MLDRFRPKVSDRPHELGHSSENSCRHLPRRFLKHSWYALYDGQLSAIYLVCYRTVERSVPSSLGAESI
jgi:hypothetical protein